MGSLRALSLPFSEANRSAVWLSNQNDDTLVDYGQDFRNNHRRASTESMAAMIIGFSSLLMLAFVLPLAGALALYSAKTVNRNRAWKDNRTLFSTDVAPAPNSCQTRRHYGNELINLAMAEADPA